MDAVEMRLVPAARKFDLGGPGGAAVRMVWRASTKAVQSSPDRGGAGISESAASGLGSFGHRVEYALRRCRADAGKELHETKAGDAVARVLNEAKQRQHVLHVRTIEELEAAELHERNVAADEFDFERAAMVGGAEQHGLLFQGRADLAIAQHLLDDVARLVGFIAHGDELRALGRDALGPKVLGEALSRQIDHAIGGRQDRLCRAVIAVERDDIRGRD